MSLTEIVNDSRLHLCFRDRLRGKIAIGETQLITMTLHTWAVRIKAEGSAIDTRHEYARVVSSACSGVR
jgi:hypothetical protein